MSLDNVNVVLKDLAINPSSDIRYIEQRTGLLRETIKRILNNLISDNIIVKQNDTYFLSNLFCNFRTAKNKDTFFGVKILDLHFSEIKYLYNKINDVWFTATGKLPKKTQTHKIIVQINYDLNLGLPIVRYKYGKITPVILQTNIDTQNLPKSILESFIDQDKQIRNIILSNINFNSKEIQRNQHKSDQLYDLKDKLLDQIYLGNIDFVVENLDKFLDLIVYDSDTSKYLDEFYSFIYNYHKLSKENRNKTEVKNLFIQVFNVIWDLIAITNFKVDIRNYYIKNNLNLENINLYFSLDINMGIERFIELLDTFDDMFMITDFFHDEDTQKLIKKIST